VRPTTLDGLEAFLRQALSAPLPGPEAQRRFAPVPIPAGWGPELRPATARAAGVLLLVYPSARGLAIPLTVRHAHLPQHGGQVSLPGGAADAGESPRDAALREAREEIGVPPGGVRVIGALSTVWIAVSNFVVYPYLAVTDEAPVFEPHPGEVEAMLDVPLAEVFDRSRLRWTTRTGSGGRGPVTVPYFDLASRVVWGATAMILGEFACLFDAGHAPGPCEMP
jgi:8-oxo-dGTP pyrophosphatase MutT (NUDIX family)